jgi:SAM-dependent methyltransferase
MQQYPIFFARFYDLIYDKIRSGTDSNYFLNKIENTKGKILEVGVGTGRFFIESLKKGADIYGIDISHAMIDVLKSKLESRHHYRIKIADICDFKQEQKYDLILAPFRVFGHLLSIEDQLKALNNINDLLSDKGLFIFDLYVPDPNIIHNGITDLVDFKEEYAPGKKVQRKINMHSDIVHQISHVEFELKWDENKQIKTETWKTEIRYFFHYELIHLIERSKLHLEDIFGDYNENPLQTGSKEFVIHCRKGK